MGQLEFANVSVKWLIINLDVHGLLDGPTDVAQLPSHYGEIVHTATMLRGVTMVIYLASCPEMFFQSFLKSPSRLPHAFFLTIHLNAFLPVDYPTFLSDIIPVLGGHQEFMNGVASFEMDLDPHLVTNILKAFTKPFGVWDHYVNVANVIGLMVVMMVLGLVNTMSIAAVGLKSV